MSETALKQEFENFLEIYQNRKLQYFEILKENVILQKGKIKNAMLNNLTKQLNTQKSFALYDENIFEIYSGIIKHYKLFLNKYFSIKDKLNENLQKNLKGLISVLKSQISFFDEKDAFDTNPISAEKKQIIATFLFNIYKDIESFIKISFEDLIKEDENLDKLDEQKIKLAFIKYLKQKLVSCYEENMKRCFNSINDVDNRKDINYYSYILDKEREILAAIVKVQITPLEQLCIDDTEKELIQFALKPIIKIYQVSSNQFARHLENIKTINPNIEINIKDDIKYIEDILYGILDIDNNMQSFYTLLENVLNKILKAEQKSFTKKFIVLKKDIVRAKNVFKYLYSLFKELKRFIKDNMQNFENTPFKDIINGIYESVKIKIENFEENSVLFHEKIKNINSILQDIDNFNLFKYDIEQIFEEGLDFDFDKFYSYITKNVFNNNFKDFIDLYNNFQKEIYNLNKDIILFEVITFEEIIDYSVIRLRDSQEDIIKNLVLQIDNLNLKIKVFLSENYIFAINPEPHTVFNAKEHEVLLAEKNELFKKGEIIKVVNCGYRIKDKVIIRANVIAAK